METRRSAAASLLSRLYSFAIRLPWPAGTDARAAPRHARWRTARARLASANRIGLCPNKLDIFRHCPRIAVTTTLRQIRICLPQHPPVRRGMRPMALTCIL
jgi:hypothetical protein